MINVADKKRDTNPKTKPETRENEVKEAAELKEVCEKFLKEEITESMSDYEKAVREQYGGDVNFGKNGKK